MSPAQRCSICQNPQLETLNNLQRNELDNWLQRHNINAKNLRRCFSDAAPMAKFLSKKFPRLVDVHMYPPYNKVELKICSWQLLNQRVLDRLDIAISHEQMGLIARSVPGCVDMLLYKIMKKCKEQESRSSVDLRSKTESCATLKAELESLQQEVLSYQLPLEASAHTLVKERFEPPNQASKQATKAKKKTAMNQLHKIANALVDVPSSVIPPRVLQRVQFATDLPTVSLVPGNLESVVKPLPTMSPISSARRLLEKDSTKVKNKFKVATTARSVVKKIKAKTTANANKLSTLATGSGNSKISSRLIPITSQKTTVAKIITKKKKTGRKLNPKSAVKMGSRTNVAKVAEDN